MNQHEYRRQGVIACLTSPPFARRGDHESEDVYRLGCGTIPAAPAAAATGPAHPVVVQGQSPILDSMRTELVSGCTGLLGRPVTAAEDVTRDGAVVVGTPQSSPLIAGLKWERQLAALGPEGFRIRSVNLGPRSVIVIASSGETARSTGFPPAATDADSSAHLKWT